VLHYLDLSNNQLGGSIPVEYGNLRLTWLYLNNNQLSGNIPVEFANNLTLSHLDLSNNQLSGEIPSALTNLTNLDRFYFDSTRLCEPNQQPFRDWLASIRDVRRSGLICGVTQTYEISGRLLDSTGQPVNDVRVEIATGGIVVAEPTTDVSGYYTALDLMENTYSVTPVKTGFAFDPPSRTAAVPPDASGVDFIGTDRFSISGQVADQVGQPIAGATVAIATGGIVVAEPTTGSDGGYIAEDLPVGSYMVTPAKPGHAFAPASRTIAVPPSALGVNFTGQRNRFTIGGRVVDGAGQPVSGMRVEIATGGILVAEPTTDANGSYTVTDLMGNTYTVTPVRASSFFTPSVQTIPVPPDQYGIDFTRLPETVWSPYRPEPDGYQFKNGSRHTNWDVFRASFGAENVERIVDGKVVPRPQAERYFHQQYKCDAWWSTCSEVGMGGNCSGMAASSALFFANWATPATFLDDNAAGTPFDLVVGDLVAGLWPENGISDFVVRYQGYQTGQQVRRAKIDATGRSVAQDLAIIKAAIDGGLQAPIYVSIQSRTGQPDCVGHALIPYAYRDTGAVTLIYVYDPNHPGDEDAFLALFPNLNAWRYDHRNSIGVWDSVDNSCGGDPLRAIPIDAWKDMPIPPWDGEDSRTQTGELTTNLVEVNVSGGASLLILDAQGRRLGMSGDNLLEEIPGAMLDIPDVVQPGATSIIPERYVFSTIGSAQPLTVQVTYVATSAVSVGQFSADGVILLRTCVKISYRNVK